MHPFFSFLSKFCVCLTLAILPSALQRAFISDTHLCGVLFIFIRLPACLPVLLPLNLNAFCVFLLVI